LIVVDSSALIAIAQDEPEAERLMHALHDADRLLISAATLTETLIVAAGRACEPQIAALFEPLGFEVEPLTEARAVAAADAYRRYGKGRHKAALNFGDSFAYALAKEMDCPLLFVGDDFAGTDITPA
jgi:ribonuclease VapC